MHFLVTTYCSRNTFSGGHNIINDMMTWALGVLSTVLQVRRDLSLFQSKAEGCFLLWLLRAYTELGSSLKVWDSLWYKEMCCISCFCGLSMKWKAKYSNFFPGGLGNNFVDILSFSITCYINLIVFEIIYLTVTSVITVWIIMLIHFQLLR